MIYLIQFAKMFGRFTWKRRMILLSFFLPVIILGIAYACRGIFPFGKWDVLIIDLYHQYAPFISDLRDKITTLSSPLYSWTGGLGTSYLPQFAYYVSSPLNFIAVLFPKSYLTEAILVLILLKAGLAGACFNYYLKGVYREQGAAAVGFSLFYALSSYVLAYAWNIMWMDVVYLLPMVVLGIVRLIRDGRGIFFCMALALMLISNFYLAFFACFFIALYFPVCLFKYISIKNPGLVFKKCGQFAFFSLLSAGISAGLLLPVYFALKLTSAAGDAMPSTMKYFFDIFDFISRHFILAPFNIREGMPNLYCGIAVLILVPVYFFSRSIPLREKLAHMVLIFILIISFNMNILDFIWNGFHYPNQLPYRYSFVYIFLILSICYPAFKSLKEFSGKQIGAISSVIIVLIILSQKLDKNPPEHLALYMSIAFVIVYAGVLTLNRCSSIKPKTLALAFLLVVIAEVSSSTIMTIWEVDKAESYAGRNGYTSGKEVENIRREIEKISISDRDFYRMEIIPPKTTNDPCLYNYRGLSIFSSTFPEKPVKMMQNLGYHSNGINSYKYEASTAVLDSIFGIKYLVHRSEKHDELIYKKIASADEITVFKNPYALSLGFLVPGELGKWSSRGANPFDVQSSLINNITGIENIFIPLNQKQGYNTNLELKSTMTQYYRYKRPNEDAKSTARIKIEVNRDRQVYLYLDVNSRIFSSGIVKAGNKEINFNATRSTIINPGFIKAGTNVEVRLVFKEDAPESGSFELYSSGLDLAAFEEAIFLMKEKSLNIESFSNTRIIGNIEAENSGLMVITVPYDRGWQVMVDNRQVETMPIDDGLLSFELPEGAHRIELRFVPDKFVLGLIISLVSIMLLIFISVFSKYRKRKAAYNK